MSFSRSVVVTILLGQLAGCGDPGPLTITGVEAKALRADEWGSGSTVSVVLEFRNRGAEAVHLGYDSVLAAAPDGEQTSLRAFRKLLNDASRLAQSPQEFERRLAPLARIGVDKRVLEDIRRDELEIAPGQRLEKTFPFRFARAPTSVSVELRYHDNATDRFFRTATDVKVNAPLPVAGGEAGGGPVRIYAPVAGAVLDAGIRHKLEYELQAGTRGHHVHLYVDDIEVAILRELKGSHLLPKLKPGRGEICVKAVNAKHVPIGVESCIHVSVR